MIVSRDVPDLREHVAAVRSRGATIGLVPTMGALHDGHLELIRQARSGCASVVLSIFVNPTQFNDPADLAAYPRDEDRDLTLAAAAGVDVVFAPPPEVVYPPTFTAVVALHGPLVETLEGAHRGPGHFAGVTTVVLKLLNMAAPDRAYFGRKDAQQLAVIRAMVRDLDLPVEIVPVDTVREPDGLALSSRNVRLGRGDRRQALALSRGLAAAEVAYLAGEREAAVLVNLVDKAIRDEGLDAEYVALVDADTFAQRTVAEPGTVLAVAAPVGPVRLIDNLVLPGPDTHRPT